MLARLEIGLKKGKYLNQMLVSRAAVILLTQVLLELAVLVVVVLLVVTISSTADLRDSVDERYVSVCNNVLLLLSLSYSTATAIQHSREND